MQVALGGTPRARRATHHPGVGWCATLRWCQEPVALDGPAQAREAPEWEGPRCALRGSPQDPHSGRGSGPAPWIWRGARSYLAQQTGSPLVLPPYCLSIRGFTMRPRCCVTPIVSLKPPEHRGMHIVRFPQVRRRGACRVPPTPDHATRGHLERCAGVRREGFSLVGACSRREMSSRTSSQTSAD
jgi:hypothetical protein